MSVHGEFNRSLESLIACVRVFDRPERAAWLADLESARIDRHADLSAAARAALDAAGSLAGLEQESPRLAEARTHLARHCRVILGLPGE